MNANKENIKSDIVRFIKEAGMLKKIKRTGYAVHGGREADTVAEHSYRAMLVGYIIAKKEGADADKVLHMLLFHDLPEARIGDLHKIAQKYINKDEAEKQVTLEQAALLPREISDEFVSLLEEFNAAETLEAKCAKDADKLELAFQAREFADMGNKELNDMIERIGQVLKTKTAQDLYATLASSKEKWWDGLKKPVEESY